MKFTLNFKELRKNNADIAGGKGASLGEMTQAGIPVPPGYVVLSSTFDEFIKEADLVQEIDSIIDSVDHKQISSVDGASAKIQSLIKNAVMPEKIASEIKSQFKELNAEFVAVRSSATAEDGADNAWAGQLDSYLNTKEENLLEKVQHCWASLFTPRAIFYRFEKGLHTTKISVAVVVQKMVNSEVSGIAFSVHPVTEDRDQMIIEAGFGLGEAIVSGQVTPDSYVVEKEPRRIIDVNVSTQSRGLYRIETGGSQWIEICEPQASSQVLSEKQILEFAELIMRIENHYGFPCDIEWAYEGGKFYIVQSRPITTLKKIDNYSIGKSGVCLNINSKKEVYEPIFKFAGYNVFMTDLFFKGYGDLNPLVTIENGNWTFWLSKKKQEELSEIGWNFALENNYFDKFELRSINTGDRMLSLGKEKFEEMNDSDFVSFLEKLFDVAKSFVEDYKKTEFIYFTKLEKELLNKLGDNVHNFLSGIQKTDDLPADTKKTVEFMKKMQNLKLELRGKINEALIGGSSLVSRVCEQLFTRSKRDDTLSMTLEEIKDLLVRSVNIKDVSERSTCSFITCGNSSLEIITGNKAEEKIKMLKSSFSKEVVGLTANKGVVKGYVKVIPFSLNPEQYLHKMNRGDILVSDTTGPDLMLAIKKAAAIVTDEGGLMSHAAVVAREFKIPCIVGTKHGTSILKDGDFVEVDADNGVVRIIK